jgi:hypothetical protein
MAGIERELKMPKQKTEKRKLAELVARQRGSKVKSAQSWLNRVAAGKVKKPKYDLTSYAKKKVRKFVRSEKAKRVKKVPTVPTEPEPIRRAHYSPDASEVLAVHATYDFYGSDTRERTIRFNLTGRELNNFLNAETPKQALETLKNTNAGRFLSEADIYELQEFRISGGVGHGSEYFD